MIRIAWGQWCTRQKKRKNEMIRLMRNIKWLAICAYAVAFVWETEPKGGAA